MQLRRVVIETEDDDTIVFSCRSRELALELLNELIASGFFAFVHSDKKVQCGGDDIEGAKSVANSI